MGTANNIATSLNINAEPIDIIRSWSAMQTIAIDVGEVLDTEERYEFLHGLADKALCINGLRNTGSYMAPQRIGVESSIVEKILARPGIVDDSKKWHETSIRHLKALHRDLGCLPYPTARPSQVNQLRADIDVQRRECGKQVLEFMKNGEAYDRHIEHLALMAIRGSGVRHVTTVRVNRAYL